ncbi:MAG: bacillithiol system redox-active protein YtxJ [Bacteroidia bacterium]|nr:bacillithiol system redox-active protein YtxJ [Bacteroidia bacterium]MCC7533061.1 bacillithiol system redox-active protein YtxJ [Bacteroidia bacterium]
MNWNKLEQIEQLVDIDMQSHIAPVVIFKHSTRCSISSAALNRIEKNWNNSEMELIKPFYVDLLKFRTTSNAIATHYEVEHQSPQILVIKNGKCIYNTSHSGINYDELKNIIIN